MQYAGAWGLPDSLKYPRLSHSGYQCCSIVFGSKLFEISMTNAGSKMLEQKFEGNERSYWIDGVQLGAGPIRRSFLSEVSISLRESRPSPLRSVAQQPGSPPRTTLPCTLIRELAR